MSITGFKTVNGTEKYDYNALDNLPEGGSVVPNPTGEATASLKKLGIDGTVYSIEGGGSSNLDYDNLGSVVVGYEFYRKNFEITNEVVDTGVIPYTEENWGRNFEFEIAFSTSSLLDASTPFVVGNVNTDGNMFGLRTDVENGTSYIVLDHYNYNTYDTRIPVNSDDDELVTVKITRNNGTYEYLIQKGLKSKTQTNIAVQHWHPKNSNHLYIGGGSNSTSAFPMKVKYAKFMYKD